MRLLALLPALAVLLAACQSAPKASSNDQASTGTIPSRLEGKLAYLQRIALDPAAIITVRIIDVTDKSLPSFKVAELTIASQGRQVPIPFAITYDAAPIRNGAIYNLVAEIHVNDTLRWRNAQTTVLQGTPEEHIEVLLTMVDDPR